MKHEAQMAVFVYLRVFFALIGKNHTLITTQPLFDMSTAIPSIARSEHPPEIIFSNIRAYALIILSGVGLLVSIGLIFVAYFQTGVIPLWSMVRGFIFCTGLLAMIEVLFLCGYRAFAQFFRVYAILLAITCIFSASFFVSQRDVAYRNLGIAFVLLATVPLISFYIAGFSLTVRKYLERRRRMRDRA